MHIKINTPNPYNYEIKKEYKFHLDKAVRFNYG